MTTHYTALIHKDEGTAYGVIFPDVKGCYSASDDSIDDAIENAIQALALHIEGLIAHDMPVPKARTLEELKNDPEFIEDVKDATVASIPLKMHMGKTMRVNITVDKSSLDLIDREAKTRRMTRSAYMVEASLNLT